MDEFLPDNDLVRYLDGEMTEGERLEFQEKLQNDSELQERLEAMATATEAVKYYGIAQQVALVHKKVRPSVSKKAESVKVVPIRRYVRYSLAVAASLLFIVMAWQGYNFFSLSHEEVYSEGFVDFNLPTTRSDEADDTTAIVSLYKSNNYDSLVKLERKVHADTDREYLLTGLAHLKLEDPFSAIEPLETVVAMQKSSYRQDAEYYLAMAYLKNRDYDKALELMQVIQNNPNHLYKDQFTDKYIRKVRMLKWR